MRLMSNNELLKVFMLRESRSVKPRVRKKNNHRALRYLNRFGLVTTNMFEKEKG